MATVIQSTLGEIITSIEDQLVGRGVVADKAQIKIVAERSEPPHFSGELDLIIRFRTFQPDAALVDGAGVYDTRFRQIFDVSIRTSKSVDPKGSAREWLVSHDIARIAVVRALHQFFPEDGNQNTLTTEPMRVAMGTDPDKPSGDLWGDSLASFEFVYLPYVRSAPQES